MERLTEKYNGYIRIKGCKTLYPSEERKGASATNAIVRLAAYEDSGLMPDEIKKDECGKWIKRQLTESLISVQCSVCHTTWDIGTHYCPNCGTKMDLEK